jgi:methionyl-tRNA formyltransferase
MNYSIAIAGTTDRTKLCAETLLDHPQLEIPFIITPTSKPIGRKKLLTPNPLHKFADSNQIPTVLVKNKIDESIKEQILAHQKPDFLLVVDFGYLIPDWLLELPRIMPLNIHPSALPKWRGSSPGQFVLLSGAATSAVTIIQMTAEFDQGPVVWQEEFAVDPSWTQTEYYQHSFQLVTQSLADVILRLTENKITPTPQPLTSPTPLATKIDKADAFVKWEMIETAMANDKGNASYLERACRAYSPWPLLWTQISTNKGQRRMQIISTTLDKKGLLKLEKVKIEGMDIKPWVEVKNVVKD